MDVEIVGKQYPVIPAGSRVEVNSVKEAGEEMLDEEGNPILTVTIFPKEGTIMPAGVPKGTKFILANRDFEIMTEDTTVGEIIFNPTQPVVPDGTATTLSNGAIVKGAATIKIGDQIEIDIPEDKITTVEIGDHYLGTPEYAREGAKIILGTEKLAGKDLVKLSGTAVAYVVPNNKGGVDQLYSEGLIQSGIPFYKEDGKIFDSYVEHFPSETSKFLYNPNTENEIWVATTTKKEGLRLVKNKEGKITGYKDNMLSIRKGEEIVEAAYYSKEVEKDGKIVKETNAVLSPTSTKELKDFELENYVSVSFSGKSVKFGKPNKPVETSKGNVDVQPGTQTKTQPDPSRNQVSPRILERLGGTNVDRKINQVTTALEEISGGTKKPRQYAFATIPLNRMQSEINNLVKEYNLKVRRRNIPRGELSRISLKINTWEHKYVSYLNHIYVQGAMTEDYAQWLLKNNRMSQSEYNVYLRLDGKA